MNPLTYLNEQGDFCLRNAQKYAGTYFNLVNEGGMMSCVTPWLAGDCKTDQNHFLLAPASMETLHESKATRNFWVLTKDGAPWSITGQSAAQAAQRASTQEEETILTGGLLWLGTERKQQKTALKAQTLSFVPSGKDRVEILQVTLTNEGEQTLELTPVAAIPLYGRCADNIRDHRHVTSLLQRVSLMPQGVELRQTLTFDERGHQAGDTVYRIYGADDQGVGPEKFIPRVTDYLGQGSYDWPDGIINPQEAAFSRSGQSVEGGEMIAAMYFAPIVLQPNESRSYQIVLSIDDDPTPYLSPAFLMKSSEETKRWWQHAAKLQITVGDGNFNAWTAWTAVQPIFRRICGCSFLPHHDYGRGGRGWRDLWQDSLALLLSGPTAVRSDLLNYFKGIRLDGTNATIIGSKAGEFRADRNGIPRVWMDHGFWPTLTTSLYLHETGDDLLLLEEQTYFCDGFPWRGEGATKHPSGADPSGTVLEHMLVQTMASFFDMGEHGHMRLRGADWNDGLDMAKERGESVAFTAAYAYAMDLLADMCERLDRLGHAQITLLAPLADLVSTPIAVYHDPSAMRAKLLAYCEQVHTGVHHSRVSIMQIGEALCGMANHIRAHIRQSEWVSDGADQHWFNSYYDNDGRALEGFHNDQVHMMLTGQVFCLLSNAADDMQAKQIVRAADWYLCYPARGGYCLNTDFDEVKLNMGRMFGFAYGHKENGAVFCHMTVMYAYALYSRGFAAEGYRVLELLYNQSANFNASGILPGIPEYFDDRGRGMYPYLTGAASWLMMTLRTQVFGVRGQAGDLLLAPKLTLAQFSQDGSARIDCTFADKAIHLTYHNPHQLDWREYYLGEVTIGDRTYHGDSAEICIRRSELLQGDLIIDATLMPLE